MEVLTAAGEAITSRYEKKERYRDLDEVAAPEDLPDVGVKAGDRGVIVDVLDHPQAAVVVEYADSDGQTKALVFYTPDLTQVVDVQTL